MGEERKEWVPTCAGKRRFLATGKTKNTCIGVSDLSLDCHDFHVPLYLQTPRRHINRYKKMTKKDFFFFGLVVSKKIKKLIARREIFRKKTKTFSKTTWFQGRVSFLSKSWKPLAPDDARSPYLCLCVTSFHVPQRKHLFIPPPLSLHCTILQAPHSILSLSRSFSTPFPHSKGLSSLYY